MITIKKYPNRRLYDTSQSRYINMDSVKSLIRQDRAFVVQDSKTGEDLTRQILMQIICEHEGRAHSTMLPRPLLKALIRQYGSPNQALLRQHLETALAQFEQEQSTRDEADDAELVPDSVTEHWQLSDAGPMPLPEAVEYNIAAASSGGPITG